MIIDNEQTPVTNKQGLQWNLCLLLEENLTIEQRRAEAAYAQRVNAWKVFRAEVDVENAEKLDKMKSREDIFNSI